MARAATTAAGGRGSATLVAAAAPPDAGRRLSAIFELLEERRREEVKRDAERGEAEAAMLKADLERLRKEHDKGHPRIARLQLVLEAVERQASLARADLRKIETFKQPERGDWTVAGQVSDHAGRPVADVELSLEGADAVLPEPMKPDADGEFYGICPAKTVEVLAKNQVPLTLVVRRGRSVLWRSPSPVFAKANGTNQFRVVLPEAPSPNTKK